MSSVRLTQEVLDGYGFGAGDQIQIFFPETGECIVGEIKTVRLIPRPENNDHEFQVDFQRSFLLNLEEDRVCQTNLKFYKSGTSAEDLVVVRPEAGCLEIANTPSEQIILLVKSYHTAFRRPRCTGPTEPGHTDEMCPKCGVIIGQ